MIDTNRTNLEAASLRCIDAVAKLFQRSLFTGLNLTGQLSAVCFVLLVFRLN